jgi:hypothetical protein
VSPFFIEACSFPSAPNRFYAARRRTNRALSAGDYPLSRITAMCSVEPQAAGRIARFRGRW